MKLPNNIVRSSLILMFILQESLIKCTLDLNAKHLQYLADHISPEHCRKLIAALHLSQFDLPDLLAAAERKVPRDVPCLEQLLHWNSEEGGGFRNAHELLSRRLKQLNHKDLALWLSSSAYDKINDDFLQGIDIQTAGSPYAIIHLPILNWSESDMPTVVAVKRAGKLPKRVSASTHMPLLRVAKQSIMSPQSGEQVLVDPTEWTIFDTISWSIVTILLLLVVVLLIYLTMASPCCGLRSKKYEHEMVQTGVSAASSDIYMRKHLTPRSQRQSPKLCRFCSPRFKREAAEKKQGKTFDLRTILSPKDRSASPALPGPSPAPAGLPSPLPPPPRVVGPCCSRQICRHRMELENANLERPLCGRCLPIPQRTHFGNNTACATTQVDEPSTANLIDTHGHYNDSTEPQELHESLCKFCKYHYLNEWYCNSSDS